MASASMETTLEASTITAAAAGQLIVGPKDAESICGWLAIGRIALLEIWVEADAGSETGQTMDLTSQSKIDRRILAMTAIPRGQFIGSGMYLAIPVDRKLSVTFVERELLLCTRKGLSSGIPRFEFDISSPVRFLRRKCITINIDYSYMQ